MFRTQRATAHRTLAVLRTINHPVSAMNVLGSPEAGVAAFGPALKHIKQVEEALEIIGTTDAADALPAPGIGARAGAGQKILKAENFLKSLGLDH